MAVGHKPALSTLDKDLLQRLWRLEDHCKLLTNSFLNQQGNGDKKNKSHCHNAMDSSASPRNGRSEIPFRLITICALVPGIILLITAGLATKHALPFLNLLPLSASAFIGLVGVVTKNKPMPKIVYADLCIGTSIILVLIPT